MLCRVKRLVYRLCRAAGYALETDSGHSNFDPWPISGVSSSVNEAGFISPDGGGMSIRAPICLSSDPLSKKIVSPHSSSPLKCQTTMARIFTGLPVGGHPRNVPKWVPRHSFSVTTHDSSEHRTRRTRTVKSGDYSQCLR